jgi:hypothetical protein
MISLFLLGEIPLKSSPKILQEYGVCYAGTLCTALSSHLEYDKCQAALQDSLWKFRLLPGFVVAQLIP